jgi:hypothetical protein
MSIVRDHRVKKKWRGGTGLSYRSDVKPPMVCTFLLLALIILPRSILGNEVTGEDLLRHMQHHEMMFQRIQLRVEEITNSRTMNQAGRVLHESRVEFKSDVWRNESKWKLKGTERVIVGKDVTEEMFETLFMGGQFMEFSKDLKNRPGSTMSGRGWVKDCPEEKCSVGVIYRNQSLIPIHGKLGFNYPRTMSEVLREGPIQVDRERIGERLLIKMSSRSRWGFTEVWLDPLYEYVPVRIKQKKEKTDWCTLGVCLDGTIEKEAGEEERRQKHLKYSQVELEYVAKSIELCDGHPLPRHYVMNVRKRWVDGRLSVSESHVSYSSCRRISGPEEDVFRLSTVPDGTYFHNYDEPQIAYEYRGGEIRKVVDEGSLEGLRGHRFVRGRWWTKGVMTLGLLALVVLGLGGYWRWRQKRVER